MIPDGQILFFCEGSAERGFGHVGRCLALAHAIHDEHEQQCIFVFRGSETAKTKIISAGYPVHEVADFNSWNFSTESTVILDLLIPLEDSFFKRAADYGVQLCTLDDPTPNRLKCSMAFYPPVPQVEDLDWSGFSGELFRDWDYIPLRREFSEYHANCSQNTAPKLLISMGGSDPKELTLKVLRALKKNTGKWSARVIAGPMFNNLDKVKDIAIELGERIEILSNVSNMAELMRNSDLAVASFGMTAYELAACGVPQLLLCLSEDHARSASALHHAGAAISLGRFDQISDQILTDNLQTFISDRMLRENMTQKAKALNIGKGATNIAAIIMQRLEQKQ